MDSNDKEAAERRRKQLISEIEGLLKKVPAKFSTWGVMETRQYKEAVAWAKKIINRERVSLGDLNNAHTKLIAFYR